MPRDEEVPRDRTVKDAWRDLVEDEKQPERINRISAEVCLLSTLWEKGRCKEVWGQGAQRFRNPDEISPKMSGHDARSTMQPVCSPEVLRHRLLLALHGLGTPAGLKRVRSGGSAASYDDVLYVRWTYSTPAQLRAAIGGV